LNLYTQLLIIAIILIAVGVYLAYYADIGVNFPIVLIGQILIVIGVIVLIIWIVKFVGQLLPNNT